MRHPQLRRARRQRGPLGLLRRRADRREPRAAHQGRLPRRARGQRLRAHRDLLADLVPAPRGGRASTPTRSASRCRWSTWRSTSPIPTPASASCSCAVPNVVQGYWNKPRGDRRDVRRRLAAHGRSRAHRRGRAAVHRRPQEGHDQPRRRERVLDRGRERARGRAGRRRGRGRGRARRDDGREGRRGDRAGGGRASSTSLA